MSMKYLSLLAAVAWLSIISPVAAGSLPPAAVEPEAAALAALAAGQWAAALPGCPESALASPILRAVRGHCLLLLNHNDESLALFLTLQAEPARREWSAWTSSFTNRFPASATALYLRGDALARTGDWKAATISYSRALDRQEGFGAALNARGVAEWNLGNRRQARRDFETACAVAPDFADAKASLGTFWVLSAAVEGAESYYQRALALSPETALFLNGVGCCAFGAGSKSDAALSRFRQAAERPVLHRLAAANANGVLLAEYGFLHRSLARGQAGNTIRSISEMQGKAAQLKQNIDFNNRVLQALPWLPNVSIHGLGWEKSDLIANTTRNLGLQQRELNQLDRELSHNGVSSAGGASTVEMSSALTDDGRWPVTTWFGLAQTIPLPESPLQP